MTIFSNERLKTRVTAHNSTYPKGGASCSADTFVQAESSVLRMKFSGKNPALRVAANRCTKGSLRSPSVQRGAAAPLLHEVLPTVAHRTTTVLQN